MQIDKCGGREQPLILIVYRAIVRLATLSIIITISKSIDSKIIDNLKRLDIDMMICVP